MPADSDSYLPYCQICLSDHGQGAMKVNRAAQETPPPQQIARTPPVGQRVLGAAASCSPLSIYSCCTLGISSDVPRILSFLNLAKVKSCRTVP